MNVTYVAPPLIGTCLRAEASETSRTRRTTQYSITVKDSNENLIATCQALVYRKRDLLPFLKE